MRAPAIPATTATAASRPAGLPALLLLAALLAAAALAGLAVGMDPILLPLVIPPTTHGLAALLACAVLHRERHRAPAGTAILPAGGAERRRLERQRQVWALLRRLLAPLSLCGCNALVLRLGGARVGAGAIIEDAAVFADPQLVEIGADAVIERGGRVLGWQILGGRLCQAPVRIAAHAIVGNGCRILPGAEVGDEAILCRGSQVECGARVASGSLLGWRAEPARRGIPA